MIENEKRKKFIKLAESRTNAIIRNLRLLSNLSNKSSYSFTNNDIEEMFKAINEEVKLAKLKFQGKEKKNKYFKLSGKWSY